jgi:CRISPR/Cas system-associated endonuclease/helicase Cas3
MSIKRYENIDINNLTFGESNFGEQSTTEAKWFGTRALVGDVANSVKIADKYRLYQDLVNFTLNYTPNMKTIVDNQQSYSIKWRNHSWRITDARESNDRMRVTFMCYRSDPSTAV